MSVLSEKINSCRKTCHGDDFSRAPKLWLDAFATFEKELFEIQNGPKDLRSVFGATISQPQIELWGLATLMVANIPTMFEDPVFCEQLAKLTIINDYTRPNLDKTALSAKYRPILLNSPHVSPLFKKRLNEGAAITSAMNRAQQIITADFGLRTG